MLRDIRTIPIEGVEWDELLIGRLSVFGCGIKEIRLSKLLY